MKPPIHLSEATIDAAGQLHRGALRLVRVVRGSRPNGKLSLAQSGVLGRLHQEGVTTATSLAAYLRIQPQSLTRLLADLEQKNLITRRPDNADRRQSLLEITEEGNRLLVDDFRGQREKLAETMSRVLTPAEQELLRLAAGLMDKLAWAVEEEGEAGE